MNAFDELAGRPGPMGLLGIAMQIPDVIVGLYEALDAHDGDALAAAGHDGLLQGWTLAAPETRAGVLLSGAWASREMRVDTPGGAATGYAADFHEYAAGWDAEDGEGFHGAGFPAMPLPGQAGTLATSLGFDSDDVDISLRTALALLAPAYQAGKASG